MMKMPPDEIVVLDIAGRRAKLRSPGGAADETLRDLGFEPAGAFWERPIADQGERQHLVKLLVEANALFSSGRDWSPEEVAGLCRDQGAFVQPYKVISWRSPDDWTVFSR